MKVTIQQVVDIEEVPLRVNTTYGKTVEQLKILSQLAQALDVTKIDDFIKDIDFLRKKMFTIDSILAECAGLMQGYQDTLQQQGGEVNEEEPSADSASFEPAAMETPNSSKEASDLRQKYSQGILSDLPDSLGDIKDLYNKLVKDNNFQTKEPVPDFPDIDLDSLQNYKDNMDKILNEK